MEVESIYENIKENDVKDTSGRQIQSPSQDEGKAQKQRGSRCLVLMTVSLGVICVLLLIFNILQLVIIKYLTDTKQELEINQTFLQHKHVLFFISNEEKSWTESRQFCRDRGADLVIINTEEKQRFITSFIKERVWIGLTDIENKGNMTWVDDSPLNQEFWGNGEPNNHNGYELCVELDSSRDDVKNWNDLPCSIKIQCICEK